MKIVNNYIGRWLAKVYVTFEDSGFNFLSQAAFNLSLIIYGQILVSFEKESSLVQKHQIDFRLRAFLKYAFSSVPSYRKLQMDNGINFDETWSVRDLEKIPPLKKEDVRFHAKELIAVSHAPSHFVRDMTSGSTGAPLSFGLDKCFFPERRARLFYIWRQVGIDPYEPTLLVSSPKFKKITPENIIYLSPARIHIDFIVTLLRLRKVRPQVFRGNPLAALEFCWLIREKKISDISFRSAILYGHILTNGMRKFIEETLLCRAFSMYALGETGAIAGECYVQRGHHLIENSTVVEIVDGDGNVVPRGTEGQILITDLTNKAMPFIRYNTGDRGKISQDLCSCGRLSPLLFVDGREEEMLLCSDGTLVFGGSTRDILDRYSRAIQQYQIVQGRAGEFVVKFVPSSGFDNQIKEDIVKNLKKIFGVDALITMESVDAILLEESGKFKQFVSPTWKKRFPPSVFGSD